MPDFHAERLARKDCEKRREAGDVEWNGVLQQLKRMCRVIQSDTPGYLLRPEHGVQDDDGIRPITVH